MKQLYFLLFLAALGSMAWGQQYRVVDYDLRLDIGHLQANTIAGSARMRVVPTCYTSEPLQLSLGSASVDSVWVDGRRSHDFSYADGTLSLPTAGVEDPFEVVVHYRTPGVVEDYGWGGFHWNSSIAYNLGVAFGEYPHSYGRSWYPCIDHFDQKATYRMELTSPAGWTTTASGARDTAWLNPDSSETSRWTLANPTPSYLLSVACGPFRYLRKEVAGYPTTVAFGTQDSAAVAQAFQQLDLVVPQFERCFGPYRWGTIGYTGTPQGSMEHVNNISLHNSAMTDLSQAGQGTMAHELSHSWFGNLVTCATSADMWFNEGGASFCEEVAAEGVKGKAYADEVYQENLYSVLQQTHVADGGFFPLYGPSHDRTYGSTTYNKGATVWHSLRGMLGEEVFYPAMQRLFADLAFGNVSTAQLLDSLQSYTGVDLGEFFRFHVYSPGFVDYSIDQFWVEGRTAHVRVSQRFRGCDTCAPLVSTPFPITFFKGHRPIATRWLTGTEGSFTLDEAPDHAIPDFHLAISDAVTEEKALVAGSGSKAAITMPLALCKVAPTQTTADTALIHVAHHWCAPGDDTDHHNPGIIRLASRYWVVDGFRPEGFYSTITFNFDRNTTSRLDNLFLPTAASVDSLRLLYREDASHPWRMVSATRVGTSNQSGSFRTALNLGQYTFAVVDEESLAIEQEPSPTLHVALAPNPAHGTTTVTSPSLSRLTLTILDLEGRTIAPRQPAPASVSLPKGTYLFLFCDTQNGGKCTRKVIFN